MESTAAARLPSILSRYQEQYPTVQIELKTDTAGGLMNRLFEYAIEVALVAEPVIPEGGNNGTYIRRAIDPYYADGFSTAREPIRNERTDCHRFRDRMCLSPLS